MKIQTRMSSPYKPVDPAITVKTTSVQASPQSPKPISDSYISPEPVYSNPELIPPSKLQEDEKPDLSMQHLLLDAFAQSEGAQETHIKYLYEKQAVLTKALREAKKKMIELHKNSDKGPSLLQPTIDIVLPLCISVIALYLGFSPDYSLSKPAALSTSIIGFAIAGLKMAHIEIPSILSSCYIAIFNLYMAYTDLSNTLLYITTFLQTLPILSDVFYTVDNNSFRSEQILAQKTIKKIDSDLKNVTAEISRAMKMIAEKGKFFSMTNDYTQLQNHIARIGAA